MQLRALLLPLAFLATVAMAADDCLYCEPGQQCWPTFQQFISFSTSLDGDAFFPSDKNYSDVDVMYDTRLTRMPYVIAMVESTADIQKCIFFAKTHNMRLSIRSSGHDYIGRSTADNSIQIYTKRMKKITINLNSTRNAAGEITAETGNTWIDLYRKVDKIGRLVVGGSAHTVALGGYTLGGGHSSYGRKFGMGVDNLLEVEMVTADGAIVTTNDHMTKTRHGNGSEVTSSDTDLFWALRGGGGGTFGVVTKFTYKLHPAPPSFVIMACYMPMYYKGKNTGLDYLQTFNNLLATTLPSEWGGYQLMSGTPYPTLPDSKGSLTFVMNHAGEWGSPSFNTILPFYNKFTQSCSFKNVSTFLEYSNSTDAIYYPNYIFNTLVQPDSFTDAYYNFLLNETITKGFGCTGAMIGGNMKNMTGDSTAVNPSFRTGVLSLTCGYAWQDLGDEDFYVHKAEEVSKEIVKLGKGVYFNEPSAYLPDWKTQYWGGHYDKLLGIKQRWDPDNIFTCLHCVGSDIKKPSLIDVIIGK